MGDRLELERLRYITAHFELLQGLVVLPATVWCGVAMAWAADWVSGWLVLVVGAAAIPLTLAAVSYYRRTYGQVRPKSDKTHSTFLLWLTIGLVLVGPLANSLAWGPTISVQGLVLAVGALVGAWFQRLLAPALLFIFAVCAGLSLLPLGGPDGPHPLSQTEVWILAWCGAAAVLAVWSHLLLRRALGPGRVSAR